MHMERICKPSRKGVWEMRRMANMIMALVLMVSFAGCASTMGMVSKDAKVKCPKCGATFTVEEGKKALDGP
jgi:nitrite reductase/ring-hydroxylating ferredoxin subunit